MDNETILKIANLSKIRLTDEEIEIYKEQFSKILNYMAMLNEVDTCDVEAYLTPVTGHLRKDEVREGNILDKETALSLSKSHDDNYYLVPKVAVN